MCGIAGYIGKLEINKSRAELTLDLMRNRGPDNQESVLIKGDGVNIALLHSRLGIIDLDKRADQPFTIGDCTIIFNGEIYNYIELRSRLKKEGCSFRTESDTEVLLQSYIAYGVKCVDHLEGMWSFAIYDSRKNTLFLSRDRFGEKPLYLMKTAEGLYFGSEVKFIRSLSGKKLSVNRRQVLRYLVNGYKSLYKTKETFFEEISELPFAMNLEIGNDLEPKFNRYWVPQCRQKQMGLEEAVVGFRQRLIESVKIRLRADVPMAFCLSGGIDSATITSIAAKVFKYDVATFSILDKDKRYDEIDNIRATIDDLGCKHTILEIPQGDFFTRLSGLVEYHDAPVYTISYYIHSFLSEKIAESGYRLVSSGTGADELVTGYYDHFNLYLYEMRETEAYQPSLKLWNEFVRPVVRNPHLQNPQLYFDQPGFRSHIYLNNEIFSSFLNDGFREDFTESEFSAPLLRNRMMNEMFHEVIPVILHEDDLNSMYYSIENRSPYLDSRLFDFAYSIPSEHLIHDGYAKYILREAARGILNEQVRLDRHKVGFNASVNSLVDFNKKENQDRVLEESPVYDFVKREKIKELLAKKELPNSYSKFIFYFLSTKLFLEKFS